MATMGSEAQDLMYREIAEPRDAEGELAPWAVLPSQFFQGSTAVACGEKRLFAAVLADAVHCYLKYRGDVTVCGRALLRETEDWIESRDHHRLLAFENVCDVLGLDPDRLRRALRLQATAGVRRFSFDTGRLRVARGRKIRV